MNDPLTPDQRRAVDEMLAAAITPINERLDRGADRMRELGDGLDAMRAELKVNTETTVQVRELLDVGKGGLRVLGWLGAGAKWLGAIAAAASAIWVLVHQATHGGQLPK